MTGVDRVQALVGFGFTERQARFLVLVMRHAGVCVGRQYARFANVAHGGAQCNAFFDSLVRRGYARASDCVHNRARLYHIHHKSLYRAIGEPNSQWRRPVPAGRAVERLVLLDAVLASPDLEWLTTRAERHAYFDRRATSRSPEPTGSTARASLDRALRVPLTKCSIGRRFERSNGAALPCDRASNPGVPHLSSGAHCAPRSSTHMGAAARLSATVRECLRCLSAGAARGAGNTALLHKRRRIAGPLRALSDDACGTLERLTTGVARGRLGAVRHTRVTTLYRRWRRQGDVVFAGLVSPAITEALETGAGRVECVVLPQTYRHLVPLVGQVGRALKAVEKEVEKGDTWEDHRFARSQPRTSRRAMFSHTSSLL